MTPVQAVSNQRLLAVDMDGTILSTDTLWESLLVLLKTRPLALALLPLWLYKGKACFKREIARRVSLKAECLPYRRDVLDFLNEERNAGRTIVLATASDESVAQSVARHLGLFSKVLASDGKVNLDGTRKLDAIKLHSGTAGFDYIGDSDVDLSVWREAKKALLVSPSSRLLKRAHDMSAVDKVFSSADNRLIALFKALRVHQWVKNLLLFVPLIMGHKVADVTALTNTLFAFFAFSFCASSVYILNDLVDLEADRTHPHKRRRPFAAGTLGIPLGLFLIPILLVLGLSTAALLLPISFLAALLTYYAITLGYTFWIKRVVILDVLTLAGLYTMRVLAGGAATGIQISPWLLAFSTFLFLSLAFMKRYAELRLIQSRSGVDAPGRDYSVGDMELLRSVGPASGLLCVLVLALYVNSAEVAQLYQTPLALWLIGPCMLYWITRLWLLAHRGLIEEDPIVFTAKDPVSYLVGAAVLAVIAAASLIGF